MENTKKANIGFKNAPFFISRALKTKAVGIYE